MHLKLNDLLADFEAVDTLQRGPVHVLDPTESAGLGTCRFSPLMGVETFDDALRTGTWLSDAGHSDDEGIKGQ